MTLVKSWNFFLCLLLNKIGLKIMFADHPVKKKSPPKQKIRILPCHPMQIFFKGVNPRLGSKIEIFFFAFF